VLPPPPPDDELELLLDDAKPPDEDELLELLLDDAEPPDEDELLELLDELLLELELELDDDELPPAPRGSETFPQPGCHIYQLPLAIC
jgi:hypothetical protein